MELTTLNFFDINVEMKITFIHIFHSKVVNPLNTRQLKCTVCGKTWPRF